MALTSGAKSIDTAAITEKARRGLLQLLESVRGKKNLVIEKSLAGTLGLFVKYSELQQYDVAQPFFLENHNVDSSQRNVVFLVRGENTKKIRMVAEQIKLVRTESSTDHVFNIIWVPRRTRVSDMILEEHGVLGEATITELPLHFVPLEKDLLSLELDDAFGCLQLRKDPSPIFASATALMMLQKQYGLFGRILGKGDGAKRLGDLLQRMRTEDDVTASSDPSNTYVTSFGLTPSAVVDNLVIIDREIDLPTVVSAQLTYEGLIDESFGISNNQTEVDSAVLGDVPTSQSNNASTTTPVAATKRKVQLDSSDRLLPSLRDANFATTGPTLQRTVRRLESDEQSMRRQDQSINDLKHTVSSLSAYKAEFASVKLHTSLTEELQKMTSGEIFRRMLEVQQNLLAGADPGSLHDSVEEMIAREVPIKTILRLLCLESCLSNGIRQRDLDNFKRQILHAYGFQHLITLANLEKMGLLVPREGHRGYFPPIAGSAGQSATDWASVRKSLRIWVDDVQEADPVDVAYVFSGFAPLSVRLVQCAIQKNAVQVANNPKSAAPASAPAAASTGTGWTGFADIVSRVRGALVDVTQRGTDSAASAARKNLRGSKEGPSIDIVFFLGGVTYAEIAALRLVSRQLEESSGKKIVVATTSIINGDRCIGAALEERRFGD